jgi:hypothetical protein
MPRIYYVGALLAPESVFLLWRKPVTVKKPHATIIYSKEWFPYKEAACFPLVIEPPYKFERLQDQIVLRFNSPRLFERHIELRNYGATWDYPDFKAHISLGNFIGIEWENSPPDFPLTFSKEYYQTWDE